MTKMTPPFDPVAFESVKYKAEKCRAKKRYRSKALARKFGLAAQLSHGLKLFVYSCNVCGDYHLTKLIQPGASAAVDFVPKTQRKKHGHDIA